MKIDRDELFLQIRPEVELLPKKASDVELFQENTIKPIIRLQNDLIIFGFRTFLNKSSSNFKSLSSAHQITFINDRLKSDPALKNSFINYIVALFRMEELNFYTKNRLEIRKRIIDLSINLLEDQLDKIVA